MCVCVHVYVWVRVSERAPQGGGAFVGPLKRVVWGPLLQAIREGSRDIVVLSRRGVMDEELLRRMTRQGARIYNLPCDASDPVALHKVIPRLILSLSPSCSHKGHILKWSINFQKIDAADPRPHT